MAATAVALEHSNYLAIAGDDATSVSICYRGDGRQVLQTATNQKEL
jgi:hypothetical protein